MTDQQEIKCFCPRCQQNTNHKILFSETETSDENDCYWWQSTYSVVKCLGCDGLQFHKEDLDEGDYEKSSYGEMEIIPRVTTYPHGKDIVSPLTNVWTFPPIVKDLYKQTFDCLNRSNFQLAAAGFRAIIEAICRYASVQGKNLETMINNLAKSHIITAKDRDHLHTIRFMGNDSIHSLKSYSEREVVIVAHIVNAILTSLYIIANEVDNLDITPISNYNDFEDFLDDKLSTRNAGEIDTLRGFIKHDRRVISEDLSKFEAELQSHIADGTYTKLSIHSTPVQGRVQYCVQ